MEPLDEEILGLLQRNARRSLSDVARQIGLSSNAVAARVRRLEADGVILGYTIITDADRAQPSRGLEVFIDVRLGEATDGEQFLAAIEPVRQIVDAAHVTGPYDYLLHARVPDTAALDGLLKHLKKACGVVQTQTRVALRSR
ncbi:AsnC family transcriptional regulator [Propionicimonas paludicola]|uniref:AsnC family transcriptional regulator n=1 Tax=Propionicimonas paludicola TaxID=185243 RepID=A0A2A9CUZ6_9ACTN|nr:Lrp/AsnC family transcriptional regulator [Propionicimonas paludicola]PFG18244.1 AsnC family transcriptional regulator [Propionicimonas paludicola]